MNDYPRRAVPTLHVVIPVFNEYATLSQCLERVERAAVPADWRVRPIVVDDASTDETSDVIDYWSGDGRIEFKRHSVNRGKGAALQTGFDHVLADPETPGDDIVIIQDADLEYDPADYPALMAPLLDRRVQVVYGTRFGRHHRGFSDHWYEGVHAWGNRVLSALSNLFTGYDLNDMESCYKLMTVDILRQIRPALTEERFGIEPQMTAALSRRKIAIEQVPITYVPRTFGEGKKIKWSDGIRALFVIVRERFRRS